MTYDKYEHRHNGLRIEDISQMLNVIGVSSLDQLIDRAVPENIRLDKPPDLRPAMSEYEYLEHIRSLGSKNKVLRSFIGQGYYGVAPLSVIIRNVLENPSWYTSYTPYQAEISQGRLEALLNFQTMIVELTGMQIANASLLDEATAAAEAMIMMFNSRSRNAVKEGAVKFFIDKDIFIQTIAVLTTRAEALGIELVMGEYDSVVLDKSFFGAFLQYPAASGRINDYEEFTSKAHSTGMLVAVAADLMSLALLRPPGEWGADIVVGSNQRFGLPMSYGGPHAGYFATKDELKRSMPGRIIGVSVDKQGNTALRMALQTREQHIRREKATSNICTAQALLATMSGMYAQYHGPEGLKNISMHIHKSACTLNNALKEMGLRQLNTSFFDTVRIELPPMLPAIKLMSYAETKGYNFFFPEKNIVSISTDEITSLQDINNIINIFAGAGGKKTRNADSFLDDTDIDKRFLRTSAFLEKPAFTSYHSETEMMRYIKMLERKDISLTHSMIPLGSCTMKLNPATAMFALSWPEFANIHPFVPVYQADGYYRMMQELGESLKAITGFSSVSFQPNSGAAGEYTGLLVIREYHRSNGNPQRNVVLIPSSAHGTNPASTVMAGMNVVVVNCDESGNINVNDLRKKAEENKDTLAAFMITYPSTHGVFEEEVVEMARIIHENGGMVYMDGANMNAQTGLTSPARIGADICHLNLHKTFAIPHGGGGPGMGPVLANSQLADFMPTHPFVRTGGTRAIGSVAAAPFGSAHILTISHAYVMMMGREGLTRASIYAILNANYISSSLKNHYKTLYKGKKGFVAHELILDCREFKAEAGVNESDIAKRLMDYGFHAPTLSFPVHGTLMVEPTESESLKELDRFIAAMKSIRTEIEEIKEGKADGEDNVLRNAPHTARMATSDEWDHAYTREKAAFPAPWTLENKFWPPVGRVDDSYGDRNLVCTCDPVESYRMENIKLQI
ncbi:MAG TPA: aminomethyl-transferring glycine dehydrogenase [Bacteroidales bacterium]|nr:aminomethyl-transferring glycine dehydrogenase [Bacteroidales bacterium]